MTDREEILAAIASLKQKVDEITEGDDLEREFEQEETKKSSAMLDIDPETVDSFGDSIELITKSRLRDYGESFQIAKNFVEREHHTMMGNRYGKHSKLIRVYGDDGKLNKIDMNWFSGCDVKIVTIVDSDGIERSYYKIRMLVRDVLTKKLLLSRIPTADGKARQEEIQHKGATQFGKPWLDQNAPLDTMKPIKYNPHNPQKTTMKNVGELIME